MELVRHDDVVVGRTGRQGGVVNEVLAAVVTSVRGRGLEAGGVPAESFVDGVLVELAVQLRLICVSGEVEAANPEGATGTGPGASPISLRDLRMVGWRHGELGWYDAVVSATA